MLSAASPSFSRISSAAWRIAARRSPWWYVDIVYIIPVNLCCRCLHHAMIPVHLSAALLALALGALVLVLPKGTRRHKLFGRLWVGLMVLIAVSSFWIGFSWIHLLSIWTLISLACAIWFIRRGNV